MGKMDQTVRDMARDLNAKRMAERELLTARFILENPNVKAKDICIVESFGDGTVTFSVRKRKKTDDRGQNSLQ